jgi:hypothetical protein
MTFPTTTIEAVRAGLATQIQRIIPRAERHRDTRWRYLDTIDVAGTLRNFGIVAEIPQEVPGAYGSEGIEYAAILRIRVAYDGLGDQEAKLLAAEDAEDLAALLVRVHASISGMFPVETERSRSIPLLLPTTTDDSEEARRVVEFVVVVHYFAADTVALDPE